MTIVKTVDGSLAHPASTGWGVSYEEDSVMVEIFITDTQHLNVNRMEVYLCEELAFAVDAPLENFSVSSSSLPSIDKRDILHIFGYKAIQDLAMQSCKVDSKLRQGSMCSKIKPFLGHSFPKPPSDLKQESIVNSDPLRPADI